MHQVCPGMQKMSLLCCELQIQNPSTLFSHCFLFYIELGHNFKKITITKSLKTWNVFQIWISKDNFEKKM